MGLSGHFTTSIMPEPEATPPRAPNHFEPTTPERVRQVELNRLRGILVSMVPRSLLDAYHSQGKTT